ncbi:MAG: TonB-dependent receptor [Steroidobacteraceae bacterium]
MNKFNSTSGARPYLRFVPMAVATTLAVVVPDCTVHAAEGTAGQELEEIIVSAQRRDQNLQETPIAVSALSGEEIAERALTNIADIGRSVPNAVFTDGTLGGGRNANFFIRGIGQTDVLVSSDPGVGIYVDGVYLGQVVGSVFEMLDIERVEVLRGPQGTLYGKNTIGGLVNVITTQPDPNGGGTVQVGSGSRDRIAVDGTVSLPLGSNGAAARVSLTYRDQDGYGERLTDGEDQSDQNLLALRAKVHGMLGGTDATLSLDGTRARENASSLTALDINPATGMATLYNALVAQPQFGTRYDRRWLTNDVYKTWAGGPNYNNLDNWGAALTLDGDLAGDLTWKSITSARDLAYVFTRDGDNSPLQYVESIRDDESRQYSQELQLQGSSFGDRFEWITGLYWFHDTASEANQSRVATGLFQALESLPGTIPGTPFGGAGNPANLAFDIGWNSFFENETNSYAAYGQGTYALTERLKLTGGMRYTYEKKDVYLEAERVATGRIAVAPTRRDDDWAAFTPRIALDYSVSPDLLLYVSGARGFKSGGFNGRALDANALLTYDPEYVTTYEAGLKSEWFGNRMRANLAIYYSDYKDIQLTAVTAVNGAIYAVTQNVAEATIKGGELELEAMPLEALTLSASVGLLDNKFDKVAAGTQGISERSQLPLAPDTTFTFGARYEASLGDAYRLVLRGDYAYRSDVFTDVVNSPILEQQGFGLTSASITLQPTSGQWAVILGGTNLTDEEYFMSGVSGLASTGTVDAHYGRPREWFLNLKLDF